LGCNRAAAPSRQWTFLKRIFQEFADLDCFDLEAKLDIPYNSWVWFDR
jgi:hypothetical protein